MFLNWSEHQTRTVLYIEDEGRTLFQKTYSNLFIRAKYRTIVLGNKEHTYEIGHLIEKLLQVLGKDEFTEKLEEFKHQSIELECINAGIKINYGNCHALLYDYVVKGNEICDRDNHTVTFDPSDKRSKLVALAALITEKYPEDKAYALLETGLFTMPETPEMNTEIYQLIEQADKCRKEIVLCLLGAPGIGKTEAIERFAKDHGRNVVHIIASQILPNEVSGITMPNNETHSMDVFDHYRLSHMEDGDILFFDELLKGQQHVLNACLTLIQERRLMSGTKLPDVLIIAAANPLASPSQLPVEIRQRFMFVDVEWNRNQWIDYMTSIGFGGNGLAELTEIVNVKRTMTAAWNTLTPRTATKLCQWMRSADNPQLIESYIGKEYGRDVAQAIRTVALQEKPKASPTEQTKQRLAELLTQEIYDCDVEFAGSSAELLNELDDLSLPEIVARLQELPYWNKIQKELAACTIE